MFEEGPSNSPVKVSARLTFKLSQIVSFFEIQREMETKVTITKQHISSFKDRLELAFLKVAFDSQLSESEIVKLDPSLFKLKQLKKARVGKKRSLEFYPPQVRNPKGMYTSTIYEWSEDKLLDFFKI